MIIPTGANKKKKTKNTTKKAPKTFSFKYLQSNCSIYI